MVAKVDAAEAFAAWRSRSNLILTLLAVLGATIVAVGAVVRQRRRATGLQELASLLESRVRERTSELEVRAAQLRALAAELTKTEERERRRLAQVLHDHLQQLLVGAKFKVAALKGRVADDSVNAALNQLSDLTDQCIAASRSLTAELAPPALYAQDLLGALRWLARWMDEKHGLAVTAHADDHGEEVDLDHRAFLFNAVRELLFNVAKHAETRQATVTVSRRDERVIAVTVEDHGCGFAAPKAGTSDKLVGGLGLFSVRERLSALGGRLEIDSAPGKGARVTVIMPLPRGEAAADAGASSSSQ
jgi:signal transduction histidine kinase